MGKEPPAPETPSPFQADRGLGREVPSTVCLLIIMPAQPRQLSHVIAGLESPGWEPAPELTTGLKSFYSSAWWDSPVLFVSPGETSRSLGKTGALAWQPRKRTVRMRIDRRRRITLGGHGLEEQQHPKGHDLSSLGPGLGIIVAQVSGNGQLFI